MAARTGTFSKRLKKLLQHPISTGALLVIDSDTQRLVAAPVAESLARQITTFLTAYHGDNPLKAGIAREELRSRLRPAVDQKLLHALLASLERKGVVEQAGAEVRLAGHTVTLEVNEQEMEERIGARYREAGLTPPLLKDVLAAFPEFPEKRIRQVIDLLLGRGELVRINETLIFPASSLAQLQDEMVAYIRREGEIDAQRFKDLTGLTRKFSIPLLEYFDRIKLTIRIDDRRVLRKG